MSSELEFVARVLAIGIGATLVMDLWTMFAKRVLGLPALDYAWVGRWIGHFPQGRFAHSNIGQATAVPAEKSLGWATHYVTGILFAAILVALWGLDWARQPTALPALIVGVASIIAPFFIMQPAFGIGVAASRTPQPWIARGRSLVTHFVFGLGLYLAALASAQLA